jgi:hypothetical protein
MTGLGCKTHAVDGFVDGAFDSGRIHGWAAKEFICGDKYIGQYQQDW